MVGMEEIRKGPWTEQEDLQLVCYVRSFGERRWDFIAKVSGLNRTGKSCRLRWVNYLHPGLKRGRMTPQEERLVLELHSRWGNRWSRIARKLPGRTDNEIKNYWRTHMRKKAQELKREASSPPMSSTSSCLSSTVSELPPKTVGRARDFAEELEKNDGAKDYSMDSIWKEIATSEEISGFRFEQCKEEVCSTYHDSAMTAASPVWEYNTSDSLWQIDDRDLKSFNQMLAFLNLQHEREPWYLPV